MPLIQLDQPSILPDWQDGDYHDYYDTVDLLQECQINYPYLVYLFSIGKSSQGRDIWCIRITNENINDWKYSCLIDGCIHGVEWESGEACLYLAEYLLINFDYNKTITDILNNTEIYIIPLVNPDGRQNGEVGNYNGVDLNRNFDIFFGRLRSRVLRLGPFITKRIGSVIRFPPNNPYRWWRIAGKHPFSEPETCAMRDFMEKLRHQHFTFYVNCHTAWHNVITPIPWSKNIINPPFKVTQKEKRVFEKVKDWVESYTEYEADRSEDNDVGGLVDYWCFKEFRIPTFCFEILSTDYDWWSGEQKHDHLVHWMKTTLPVFMYLLVNSEPLYNWETPNIHPPLPEGVPPPPLGG